MKKAAVLVLALAILMLAAAVAPAVSAKTLKCDQVIYANDWGVPGPNLNHPETFYWKGTISGDIAGTSYYWETAKNYVVGKVEHFFEDFYIDLGDGEWISGYDNGVWNFATFKFRATGRVTDASPNYAYMIGCKFHEEGVTTDPGPDFANLPIIGTGTCFIGP